MWVFLSLVDDSESVQTQKKEIKTETKENWCGWSNQEAGVCSLGKNIAMAGSALVTSHLMLNSVQWSQGAERRCLLLYYYINCNHNHSMLW